MRRRQKKPAGRPDASKRAVPAAIVPPAAVAATPPERTTALAISLALIVATLIVYAPVRRYDFVDFDDPLYVSENPHLSGGLTAGNISWALTAGYATNWHPLTWMSHMLDVQLFGLNPGPQHVTNLILHIANTLILFWVLNRITGAIWKSGFVAALFALHPLHVESVAWISERKDVLSTLFWLLTMWAYASYARQPRWTRYLGVMVLFTLGLMSKPMLVTLPIALLLLDVWPLARVHLGWRRLVLEKLPLLALAAASVAVTFLVQLYGGAVAELGEISLGKRGANALTSYAVYIAKMIWPARLTIFYPYPPAIPVWQSIAGLLVLACGSFAAVRLARRHPYVPVGWFWYVVTMLPVIGIVQVGRQALADRYTYVPFIGLFIIVAWGVPDLLARWPQLRIARPTMGLTALAATAVLVACTITARAQVRYWQNSSTLWYHALDVTADNDRALNGVGIIVMKSGRTAEAVADFSEAVRIDPKFSAAQHNLGIALASQGKLDDAIVHYREAIRIRPDMAEAHHNLGLALALKGQLGEAITQYHEALQLKPDMAEAHGNLGGALASEGRTDEAIAEYREAIRLRPGQAEAHSSLGRALAGKGRLDEAAGEYREAIRLKPAFADAHVGLGFVFTQQGRVSDAISEYSQALKLSPDSVEAHYNRGYALATQRHIDEAIADFAEAVRLKPDFDAAHLALAMAYGAAGRTDDANREFARAKAAAPR